MILTQFESDTLRLRFGLHSAAGTPQPICSLDEAGRRLNVGRDKVRSYPHPYPYPYPYPPLPLPLTPNP